MCLTKSSIFKMGFAMFLLHHEYSFLVPFFPLYFSPSKCWPLIRFPCHLTITTWLHFRVFFTRVDGFIRWPQDPWCLSIDCMSFPFFLFSARSRVSHCPMWKWKMLSCLRAHNISFFHSSNLHYRPNPWPFYPRRILDCATSTCVSILRGTTRQSSDK